MYVIGVLLSHVLFLSVGAYLVGGYFWSTDPLIRRNKWMAAVGLIVLGDYLVGFCRFFLGRP